MSVIIITVGTLPKYIDLLKNPYYRMTTENEKVQISIMVTP